MSEVDGKYRECVGAMSASERVRRAEEMFCWSRDFLARTLAESSPGISETDLKWEIAIRQYGSSSTFKALVRECRSRASR
jgi:hypothetical protein